MNRNHLTVDIYCDGYPEPKFIGQTELPTTSAKNSKLPITIVKDAKIIDTNEIDTQHSSEIEDKNSSQWFAVISSLVCLGVGIACVIIALQQNEPDDNHIVKLEGSIVYVFYLGVCILFCLAMCLCGTICMRCCSDFCLLCCGN